MIIFRVTWFGMFLLLLLCTPLHAQRSDRLTLQLNRASLAEFVRAVEAATDYTFVYSEDVQLAEPITLNVRNASLKNVLNTALEGQPVRWEIEGNHILLMRQRAQVRNVVLSGRVTDAQTGEPLAGASIYNPQRRTGTTTNANGYYTLTQPNNVDFELVFSYVGYASKTHQLKLYGNRQLNVALEPGTTLQEVEVYGTRHNFGAQSSQMSAIAVSAEQIRRMPALLGETDVLKSLQRLPGVQSSGEGRAGIHVRGGEHDQNLFTLDGITLYNPEHLQGFTSAINNDILDDVVLYKGAFPSQYGNRLSSVVDIGILDGDMERYRASFTAGMLASRIHVEGPIWKEHTSFNIAARASYFNAIVKPLLEEVVYDNPDQMNEFAHMKYYDINAKLVHKLTDRGKLAAVFYMGHDVNNATPNRSAQHFEYESVEKQPQKFGFVDNSSTSQTQNSWNNLLMGVTYNHQINSKLYFDLSANYSGYDCHLDYRNTSSRQKGVAIYKNDPAAAQLYSLKKSESGTTYTSEIRDLGISGDVHFTMGDSHEIHSGIQFSSIGLTPTVSTFYNTYEKRAPDEKTALNIGLAEDRYTVTTDGNENLLGSKEELNTLGIFLEDSWDISARLKANIGLRFQTNTLKGKTHQTIEPRVSMRMLIADNMSLKVSYARMSQGLQLLNSGTLLTPSEVWVPVAGEMKVGTSDQISAGYNFDMRKGIQLSVEGYYKWLDNVVDYREGATFQTGDSWTDKIAQGKGRAYGIELMVQKTVGNTTGIVSYTWSKSLRTFDREGMVLNGGREFFSKGDRRHNISINISQRLSKNWDLSAAWTYQTGRRTILPTKTVGSSVLGEFNNYRLRGESDVPWAMDYTLNPDYQAASTEYHSDVYIDHIIRTDTYGQRNAYVMPAVHRLDISLSHHGMIGIGEMICDVGIYNLYNHQNISTVYWGYQNNRRALKGVCLFPIMPSLSLTLKF